MKEINLRKKMYWFRRKYWQIKRVIEIIPLVWNSYDFDYHYAITLFKFQLGKIADYLESNNSWTQDAKINAQKIRTAIRLMDKVYNEEYAMEYMDTVDKLYGETRFDRKDLGDGTYEIVFRNEKAVDENHQKEIDEVRKEMMIRCMDKQKQAHKLLWDYIEHNIQWWWD